MAFEINEGKTKHERRARAAQAAAPARNEEERMAEFLGVYVYLKREEISAILPPAGRRRQRSLTPAAGER